MAAERALYAKENRRLKNGDQVDVTFLMILLVILGVGLAMLYSASAAQSMYDTGYESSTRYLGKQAVCAVIGLIAMAVISRIPAEFWLKLAWPLYWFSIALLLLVLLFGETVNGAKRWINIAGLQFQPSEIAKFTLILLLAKLTRAFGSDAKTFRYGVLGFGTALMGILVPLALERHLSAIMLLGMVTGKGSDICVGNIGLSGLTHADGLAVGRPSGFVGRVMENLLDGIAKPFQKNIERCFKWQKM